MNTFILVNSLRFLKKFGLLANLSTWIIDELIKINNHIDIFNKEVEILEYDIFVILVKKLIDLNIDFDKNLLLRIISCKGDNELVRLLIEAGADVTADDNCAIKCASGSGHLEVVRSLLDAGADVTAEGNYALRWASRDGHHEVVKLLIDAGADVTAEDNYALRWASLYGHDKVVELLIDAGATLN